MLMISSNVSRLLILAVILEISSVTYQLSLQSVLILLFVAVTGKICMPTD